MHDTKGQNFLGRYTGITPLVQMQNVDCGLWRKEKGGGWGIGQEQGKGRQPKDPKIHPVLHPVPRYRGGALQQGSACRVFFRY